MAVIPSIAVTKWRALSLKRLGYMTELQRTGRWQRMYASQDAFEAALRLADADAAKWHSIENDQGTTDNQPSQATPLDG
jgi:hypothetical protein